MEIITENRHRMITALLEIEPIKMISFSQIDIRQLDNLHLQVIINTKFLPKQRMNEWNIRTNNKVHSKIAIGKKGVLFGSWNFSQQSTLMMHEIVTMVRKEDDITTWQILNNYFETLWARSTPVTK